MTEPELRLNLLGPPEVHLGEQMLSFPTRKTLALLIYLALERHPQPREHLATLFWPEANPERSYASLRNTLGRLQAVLRRASEPAEYSYLAITHTTLTINPEAKITVNLDWLERAYLLARADRAGRATPNATDSAPILQAAADQYRGDFLVGFSLNDAPTFDDWASNQREVWRRRLGLVFDRLYEIRFAQGDLAGAAENASAWISLDTLNELAYRCKMRAHFAAGERGQALETYALCRSVLWDELGVEPEPETESLAARIRAQHPARSAEALPRPDTPVAFLESLFAGRSEELQTLLEHYETAVSGHSQVLVLRGEAGIGKTRLAAAFLDKVRVQGAETLVGRTFESGSGISYHPLVDSLRAFIQRNGTQWDWVPPEWLTPLGQLLPELHQARAPVSDPLTKVDVERAQLFEALAQLTLAMSQRSPLIFFIDDLHWADRATLDWLVYTVRRWRESKAPIMLLANLRSEALQPLPQSQAPSLLTWLNQIVREADLNYLELAPLSEHDAMPMLLSVLTPPADDFAQWLYNETRGQPFYLIETLKDLLERRALHPRSAGNGHWVFDVATHHDLGKAVRVPSTVHTVVRARLHRLSPNAFTLLAAAAVLDHSFSFAQLCAITQLSADAGLPPLDELLSSRLLVEFEQVDRSATYAFPHNMIRDVVYTEAGDARRRLFHQRALDLLEANRNAAAVLAHHALASGLPTAAFRHSLTAGQEALRLAAANEAQAFLEKARELALEDAPDSTEIEQHIHSLYAQLATAYELSGQIDQAQAVHAELQRRLLT